MVHPITEAILDLDLDKLKILCEEKEDLNDVSSSFPNASEARLVCVCQCDILNSIPSDTESK